MPDPRPISDLNRALDHLAAELVPRKTEQELRDRLALAFDAFRRALESARTEREARK